MEFPDSEGDTPMKSINVPGTTHRTDEWQSLPGAMVEVRRRGEEYRSGVVEDAMPDASGIWLAADGALGRELIEKAEGYEIWTALYPRSHQ
jgi:hypothetical protein